MTTFSKEIVVKNRLEEKKKIADTVFIINDLPNDLILVVFSFLDFVTLCCVKPVCKWWMESIVDQSVERRLGKKTFVTREELKDAVLKYCICKSGVTNNDNSERFAESLARTYGWPIGKWDVLFILLEFSKTKQTSTKDIGEWDMSNAITFYCMFKGARSFNQDLSKWNTSNVLDMSFMFCGAKSFNQDLSSWNTSEVLYMNGMFRDAASFCQNISSWNVSAVQQKGSMFYGASSFNNKFEPRFHTDSGDDSQADSGNWLATVCCYICKAGVLR
mmetsp:Transcript_18965/g.28844  ORF Transcript_18965/g.28844 Transcript_18965/m.28844 type:complete len:274 (+) Transcript_18965:110-931(+)